MTRYRTVRLTDAECSMIRGAISYQATMIEDEEMLERLTPKMAADRRTINRIYEKLAAAAGDRRR